jgi:hypothetical protein
MQPTKTAAAPTREHRFSTPAAIFQRESFVRAGFEAFCVVPDPSSLALVRVALGGLAMARKRIPN